MIKSSTHCCDSMREQVSYTCADHTDQSDCPDSLISYSACFDEYGLRIHDGGSSTIEIKHCPWCGVRLPESRRDEWFERLDALGFDQPFDQELPPEFDTDAWYRS